MVVLNAKKTYVIFLLIFCVLQIYGMQKLKLKHVEKNIYVDISGKLCEKEIRYIKKRKLEVAKAQEQLTGKKLSKNPLIGFSFSGGGYRAFIAMLGFLLGAKKVGLFESATYMAGLSGSAWGLMTLLARRVFFKKKKGFLEKFRKDMQIRMAKNFWNLKNIPWREIIKRLFKKYKNYGDVEPADLWGALIAYRLMGDLPQCGQNLSYKNIRSFFKKNTHYPYPLCSGIIKDTFDQTEHYESFEVGPYSCGSTYLHGFIPTKYLGSTFNQGELTKKRKEETLAFLLGLLGSPYDLNIGDLLLQMVLDIPQTCMFKSKIEAWVRAFIKKYRLAKKNVLPSKINNITYKMPSSPYAKPFLTITDTGFEYNLTIPILLRRKVNVIVCGDGSSDATEKGFPELVLAKAYADRNGYAFPSLAYYEKKDANLFVFKWDNNKKKSKKFPTIIYFTNGIAEPTSKLQYAKKEFNKICDFMKNMLIKYKGVIAKEIVEKSKML